MLEKEQKPWYLKQMHLFEGISEKEIMAIAERLIEKQCVQSEVLYTPFDVNDSVFLLKEGEVTLYHLHNGKKIILDVLTPGDIWGAIDFEQKNRTHFAEVSKNAFICILPLQDFLAILTSYPELMLRFLQRMSSRMSYYEERMKDPLMDAKERVQSFLKRSTTRKTHWWNKILPTKQYTHEDIANLTGLSRETVSRVITEIRKDTLRDSDQHRVL